MSLSKVKRFVVPSRVIEATESQLRTAGRRGRELFVLWSGVIDGAECVLRSAHVPRQTSFELEEGLLVRVDGPELHRLNTWLYDHHESLAIQVHAHPTDAFHSVTDDTYPIVTAEGSISIVAADFCRDGLRSNATAAYRLKRGRWRELNPPLALIRVV